MKSYYLRNRYFALLFAFIIIEIAIVIFINYDKNERIKKYLQETTSTMSANYKSSFNTYKMVSRTIYTHLLDTNEVIKLYKQLSNSTDEEKNKIRKKLYNLLINRYEKLNKLGLQQLHFHLKNNKSFLRFHYPHKFDDDLSEYRFTVSEVNKNSKEFFGWEMGRVIGAFRFVYPIKDEKDNHLGSVEISISNNAFTDFIEETFKTEVNFLIKKEILDKKLFDNLKINYKQSNENKNFYIEKSINHFKYDINKDIKKSIEEGIKTKNSFSLYLEENKKYKSLTFIPIPNVVDKNKIAAYLAIYKNSYYLEKLFSDYFLVLISITIFNFFFVLFMNKLIYTLLENKDKQKTIRTILDSAHDIILLTNGIKIQDVNQAFFKLFNEYKTLEEFKKDYECICDRFEKFDGENYIYEKSIDGMTWADYIEENKNKIFKVVIKNYAGLNHFEVTSKKILVEGNDLIVIELHDITQNLKYNEDLMKKNAIISQQSKMASLGEMISNIAHQWRQPLSAISVAASGIKLQKEMNILEDKLFFDSVDLILNNSRYLSKTIDDFRDFIISENRVFNFDLIQEINAILDLQKANIDFNFIEIKKEYSDKELMIESNPNQLAQVLMNILNNAKESIILSKKENKFIIVSVKKFENSVIISVEDSGDGIDESILNKIFEPYFTTKHQSRGTGIGLYISYQIVNEKLKGKLEVQNIDNGGAKFTITLPLFLIV